LVFFRCLIVSKIISLVLAAQCCPEEAKEPAGMMATVHMPATGSAKAHAKILLLKVAVFVRCPILPMAN
jgi:hypothetical protein